MNAFCYYGVVLFTTVLFQSEDECHGGGGMNSSLAECKPLVQKDYIDLLSTTLAEFPGSFGFIVLKHLFRSYHYCRDYRDFWPQENNSI